nr:integrase, catalytic region, zinc finger, CCHC-type, peptidase aspartic, catalytic [Tanacetum cinerariifolium]
MNGFEFSLPNTCEMWKAIERLKQGESINVQDLETNLYWEFGKFTSQDGESLESYYSRFYKMMNELIRNQCKVTNHQVNVQFLLQLQPEWKRAERIARVANPLVLVAQQQPVYHPQTHPTHSEFLNQITTSCYQEQRKINCQLSTTIYDQEPSMVAEDDEMSKDKEIDKLIALISLSFKKIYKPTNNNLRASSNTSRANQDNSQRINRSAGYENQRTGNVAGARETDAAYHREKMLICKQEEAGIQLNAEQADWRDDTDDDELEDQELEAHYMYMAQLQEVSPDAADSGPIFDDEPLQKLKFLGTVKFGNDKIAPIIGYGDLVQGAVMIKRVYYVEGLNHNLFSISQFCDADLEVAFRKSTCYIRDLKGNDLLTGSRGMDLYSITLQDTNSPNPIFIMAKASSSQAWLWHRRLSHLNFDTINLLSKHDIV